MNSLQRIELSLLKEFIDICNILNLNYYLVCGSALGAAKYNGFIPWDDDIDVAMPRSDYNIFCKKANKYLDDSIFLQNYKTDENVPFIYSKLRKVNTTFIERAVCDFDINHGVYIDIFPIDGYPNNNVIRFEIKKKVLKALIVCSARNKTRFPYNLVLFMLRLFSFGNKRCKYIDTLVTMISKFSIEESNIWCNHGNWQGKKEYASSEQYGKGVIGSFENLSVRLPEKIDEYLTQKYGKWKDDLSGEYKVSHHYAIIIDLRRSYTCYVKKKKNGKIEIRTKDEVEKMFPIN